MLWLMDFPSVPEKKDLFDATVFTLKYFFQRSEFIKPVKFLAKYFSKMWVL